MRLIDLSGKRFGRLTVLRRDGTRGRTPAWQCRCDCGRFVIVRRDNLKCGYVQSCGCLRQENSAAMVVALRTTPPRHGHARKNSITPTYVSWAAMLTRCTNSNHKTFEHYGARGIRVCDRWRLFDNFLEDMGERPEGKTLDRYPDPAGDYEPGNCRWATPKEQRANQRMAA